MNVINKQHIDECKLDNYSGNEILSMIECGEIPTIKAISIDRIKQAREEIENLKLHKAQFLTSDNKVCIDSDTVLAILGKLIEMED